MHGPALMRAVRETLGLIPTPLAEIVRAVDAPYRMVLAAPGAELQLAREAATHVGSLASRAV